MLPARKRSVGRRVRPLLVSETPAAARRPLRPSLTSAMTPGDPPATTCRSWVASVGRVAVVAPAETAVAGAAALAAALSESPRAGVEAAAGAVSAGGGVTGLWWGGVVSPASPAPCPR